MPFTRSSLWSSVTTRRVWPEETQRRSASLDGVGDVDGDHRGRGRHHLARLLLVQVEDAGQHPRLAGVELAAGHRLLDQHLDLLRRLPLVEVVRCGSRAAAGSRSTRALSSAMKGRKTRVKTISGRATSRAIGSDFWIA